MEMFEDDSSLNRECFCFDTPNRATNTNKAIAQQDCRTMQRSLVLQEVIANDFYNGGWSDNQVFVRCESDERSAWVLHCTR